MDRKRALKILIEASSYWLPDDEITESQKIAEQIIKEE